MKVHFIQQDSWVEPGEYLSWAMRRGYDVTFTRCWMYDSIPRELSADILIVLGGYQCPATTKEQCDYFDSAAEQRLIRKYVDAGRIVIGVCLGAQLLGEAMGAEYEHSPEKEIGPVRARLTEAGKADPFLKSFPETFDAGEWHNDMPGLTPDAVILAESDGCPRQIVRFAKYAYAFQTHMEFNRKIIAAGIEDCGGKLGVSGPYVQSEEELLEYDYTDMNRMLSRFLDAIVEDYAKGPEPTVTGILEKMIAFSEGNIHDIDHLIRVWTYAKMIGEGEELDPETQFILEVAAVTHDIACPLCREKYGNTNGKRQEEEGAAMIGDFLEGTGMSEKQIDRVAFLIGHHHTFAGIDGIDWQILVEADYIANASENGCGEDNIRNFIDKIAKTESGKRLIGEVFRL